jgi:hypothetical protein
MTGLDPQLQDYLDRGWLVFPCSWRPDDRTPLVTGGFYGASNARPLVASWWREWPLALAVLRTGKCPQGSGIVIVDVDVKHGVSGFALLARLVGPEIPQVPRVTTPSGGMHLYYLAPPGGCITTTGAGGKRRRGLGLGLDVKGDLGCCHCPGPSPLSQYRWDAKFNLHTVPLLPLPAALTPVEIADEEDAPGAARSRRAIGRPDAYGEAALANACRRVRETVPGSQRDALNAEAYALGGWLPGSTSTAPRSPTT